jgi:hypothetical protein
MIACPTCATRNDEFAIVCSGCKGYLQNRVPNLDLFQSAWAVLESPRKAFRQFRLAEHKNYSILLFSVFGIALSFTCFWYLKLGDRFSTLIDVIIWALISGAVGGVVLVPLLAGLTHGASRLFGGTGTFRDSMVLLAYSFVPVVIALFVALPLELMTFGMFLFTSNPHPYVIKPVSYFILLGMDAASGLWTLVLVVFGLHVIHQLRWSRSIMVAGLVVALLAVGVWVITRGMDTTRLFPG